LPAVAKEKARSDASGLSLKSPSECRRDNNQQMIMIRDDRHQQLPSIPD
jgi:hypothetical protein